MYALYFLSIIYIAFGGFLLLLDSYRAELSFMLKPRQQLEDNNNFRYALSAAGLLLFIMLLLFPIDPGPRLLGDLIPSLASLVSAFCVFLTKNKTVDADKIIDRSNKKYLGFTLVSIAFVHFLLPSFVLL